jgi:putative membrane protein
VLTKLASTVAKGFGMGAADIVPGVSGGTIALVVGIYEQLLHNVGLGSRALGHLVKGDVTGFRARFSEIEWNFLLPLAAGILLAIGLLSSLIERLLRERPEEMAGLFFGLVLGSIVVAWGQLRGRTTANLAVMLAVGAAAFVLLGFQTGPAASPPMLAYLVAGAIAICAMILPGISGSFLLLMMGMYAAVLGAVHDRGGSDLADLAVFAAGAVVGLALFSTGLGWMLDRYHDQVLAVLIGLMVGSFRVLWPWPHGVGIISDVEGESIRGTGLEWPEAGDLVVPALLAVVAFLVVVAFSRFAGHRPTADVSDRPPVASA